MNLKFMSHWPARMHHKPGNPTYFVDKVYKSLLLNSKVTTDIASDYFNDVISTYLSHNHYVDFKKIIPKHHTIRSGQRWKKGDKIHFQQWAGKPYKSKCIQFAPVLECVSVQKISIHWYEDPPEYHPWVSVDVDNFNQSANAGLDEGSLGRLALNDGFNSVEDFLKYFNEDFEGQIIHWTNLRY